LYKCTTEREPRLRRGRKSSSVFAANRLFSGVLIYRRDALLCHPLPHSLLDLGIQIADITQRVKNSRGRFNFSNETIVT